ncbi:allophanate hydrolase [Novispirillum sp. DQ9]|uniref:allophanate hydrolase n=1 Tax=Novispirillum sp. DQ9 TaxID=3398612 RepID=UPI003C7B0BF8
MNDLSFDLASLSAAYADGRADPESVAREAQARARAQASSNVWIALRDDGAVLADARALAAADRDSLPLYGVPFAVKDNIDVAGMPTTAACPEFAYTPSESATVVQALQAAGAILIGKTNLDQFATGLVGVRSPYGPCRNPFNGNYVSGGSSSGSAVAVAGGAIAFSLGTDTAGSGRVPAAFCNIVGWKGTRGLVSTRGVVPACRSLDCVTVFALTCDDAATVAQVAAAFDAGDPFSRPAPARPPALPEVTSLRLGVPRAADLAFFGNPHTPALFEAAKERFAALGATLVEVDMTPFLDAARLLYEGPWVAERTAAVGAFLAANPQAGEPVVRAIIEGGSRFSAAEAFAAQYRLRDLAREAEGVWDTVDAILTPTAGTIHTIEAVQADPVALNSQLGYYTNFMNLLDLSAVAVPAGFQPDGLPFGVTVFAPAFHDGALLALAAQVHRDAGVRLGATGHPLPPAAASPHSRARQDMVEIAVFGAHMQGLPLSRELTERRAQLIGDVVTAPVYRLYLLDDLSPVRPGLVRVAQNGARIAGELWSVPAENVGDFLEGIAAPLGLGRVELADGRRVIGFLCEASAVSDAPDISIHGGWKGWLAAEASCDASCPAGVS